VRGVAHTLIQEPIPGKRMCPATRDPRISIQPPLMPVAQPAGKFVIQEVFVKVTYNSSKIPKDIIHQKLWQSV